MAEWAPKYIPGGKPYQFCQSLGKISDHLEVDEATIDEEWHTKMGELLRSFHKEILTTFTVHRQARESMPLATWFVSKNLADAIISTEKGRTGFSPYHFVINSCSRGLNGLVRMWKIYESGKPSIGKEMQQVLNELGFGLMGLYLGKSEMLEWGNLERYRLAEDGPPEKGRWAGLEEF